MDGIIDALKQTCQSKVKANAVKQEFEKLDELRRSALRAFLSLLTIPEADKCPAVISFYESITKTPDLQQLFDQTRKDSQQNAMTGDLGITPMDVN
jgi:cullin-associated NEDD8-dissociated protein 1